MPTSLEGFFWLGSVLIIHNYLPLTSVPRDLMPLTKGGHTCVGHTYMQAKHTDKSKKYITNLIYSEPSKGP